MRLDELHPKERFSNRVADIHSLKKNLGERQGLHIFQGSAEHTELPDASVDLVTCAQAFHWFDPVKTRVEFDRILVGQGQVALVFTTFDHFQILDLKGFAGRFFSSSYAPTSESPEGKKAYDGLSQLFERFGQNGKIRLEYKTELFLGR